MGETVGFPPADLTGTRTDSTPNATTQAADHTDFMARLNQLVAEVVAHEANVTTAHDMIPLTQKGAMDGVATLGGDTLLPIEQLPLTVPQIFAVGDQASMLAQSSATFGDLTLRYDEGVIYMLTTDYYGTLADWKPITGSVAVFNDQSGASYTLALTDASKTIRMTSGSANTLLIPTDASVPFRIGQQIDVWQIGAGLTTLQPVPGGTPVISARGQLGQSMKMAGAYAAATLVKAGTNAWYITGDIVP